MPMLGKEQTPWDRMKKTGAVNTGPEHPAMEGMSDEPEAEEKGPPNLRSRIEEANICGTCSDFQGASCAKYGVDCKFHEGCDDHSAMREEENEGEEEKPSMSAEEVEA